MSRLKRDIARLREELSQVRRVGDFTNGTLRHVRKALQQLEDSMNNQTVHVDSLRAALVEIAACYDNAEKQILALQPKRNEISDAITRIIKTIREQSEIIYDYLKGFKDYFCYAGDPVNMSTGNFYLQEEDFIVMGFVPVSWTRYYNAQRSGDSPLGNGWGCNHSWKLVEHPSNWILINPDGGRVIYERSKDGTIRNLSGQESTIVKNETTTQVKLVDSLLTFDKEGNILREDKPGNGAMEYHYEGGRLSAISRDGMTILTLSYDEIGHLTSVSDPAEVRVRYEYSGPVLKAVIKDGNRKEYEYDEALSLKKIINPDGTIYLRNEYDEEKKITAQTFTDGSIIKYEYRNDETILTRQDGSQVKYVHDSSYRHVKTIFTDGEESTTYNRRDQIISFTDKLGNLTRYSYDNKGNLTSVIDALGNHRVMTYDAENHLIAVKEPNGGQVRFQYDSNQLIRRIDPCNETTTYEYDQEKRPVKITLPTGAALCLDYDARGNVIKEELDSFLTLTYSYDDRNRKIAETDGEGNTWQYSYDAEDRIIAITDPIGNQRTVVYGSNGKVTQQTDFDGAVKKYEYNDMGMMTRFTDPEGRITNYYYDSMNHMIKKVLPTGVTSHMEYDENGRMVCEKTDGIITRRCTYDALNQPITVTDALEQTVSYSYDALGRVISIQRPDGHICSYEYDEMGNVIEETDYSGSKTFYQYDLSGRIVSCILPSGAERIRIYGDNGLLMQAMDETGLSTVYRYGTAGLMTGIEKNGNKEVAFEYDHCGRRTKEIFQSGYERYYTYDPLGRRICISDSEGMQRSWEYDAVGRTLRTIDAENNINSYAYGSCGELLKITDPYGSSISYEYNAFGQLSRMTKSGKRYDPESDVWREESRITHFENDRYGNLTVQTDPDGLKTKYGYDPIGRRNVMTDRNGNETQWSYSDNGDISQVTYQDGNTVHLEYNANHQLMSFSDWNGTTRILRDDMGHPTEITDHNGLKTTFFWGKRGEKTGILFSDNIQVHYDYDEFTRLSSIRYHDFEIRYAYDDLGRLMEKTDLSGTGVHWKYDESGRIIGEDYYSGGQLLKQYSCIFDAHGNQAEIRWYHPETGDSSNLTYQYDKNNRIQQILEDGKLIKQYTYDGFGNIVSLQEEGLSRHQEYDILDRLVRESLMKGKQPSEEILYRYDPMGNLTEKRYGEQIHSFEYNAYGRMVTERSDNSLITRTYNGLGHMVAMESGDSRKIWSLDLRGRSDSFLAEGQSGEKYIWDPYETLAGIIKEDGSLETVLTDHQGSVQSIHDQEGNLLGEYSYDEYGSLIKSSGIWSGFGFTGYLRNEGDDMYYAQARFYDDRIQRFVMEDPLYHNTYNVQTTNPYAYCYNQPMIFVDRDGNIPTWDDITGAVSDFGNTIYDYAQSTGEAIYHNVVQPTVDTIESIKDNAINTANQYINNVKSDIDTLHRLWTDPNYHYARNYKNTIPNDLTDVYTIDPSTKEIKGQNGWELMSPGDSACHKHLFSEQGPEAINNYKFIKRNPDGTSSEIVISIDRNGNPKLVNDPINIGTYNYYSPGSKIDNIKHILFDMVPYYIHGNDKRDNRNLFTRLIMDGEAKLIITLAYLHKSTVQKACVN